MLDAYLLPHRRTGQRGAIAVMAAILMPMLIALMATTLALLWLFNDKRATQNVVDAAALGWGDQIIINRYPNYTEAQLPTGVNIETIRAGSNQPGVTLGVPRFNDNGLSGAAAMAVGGPYANAWVPVTVNLVASNTSISPVAKLLARFTGGAGTATYTVETQARVNQIQISTFNLSPARLIFLLDYSRSMRLYYAGHANDPHYAAINRVRADVIDALNDLASVFNFGLVTFADLVLNKIQPVRFVLDEPPPTVGALEANRKAIVQAVTTQHTSGNGTDTAEAIMAAMAMVAANEDRLAGAPTFVMISDGEPDMAYGRPCTESLATCVAEAVPEAQKQMATAWSMGPPANSGADLQSFSYLIDRSNSSGALHSEDRAFMLSISGDHNHVNDANNFSTDNGTETQLKAFLSNLPVRNYCVSNDLGGLQLPENVSLPATGDWIMGYYTLGDQPNTSPAYAANHPEYDAFAVTQAMSMDELFEDLHRYPMLDPTDLSYDAVPPSLIEGLNTPGLAKFYYDPETRRVWFNPWLCFNVPFFPGSQTTGGPAHFRMRWGEPQLVYRDAIPGFNG